jgi:hypothetical protein
MGMRGATGTFLFEIIRKSLCQNLTAACSSRSRSRAAAPATRSDATD